MTQPKKPIPTFASVEEEAAFWDAHDTTDYAWERAEVRFACRLSQGITIRFSPEKLEQLRQTAHERGLGPTTLARMWVLEHLQADRTRPQP